MSKLHVDSVMKRYNTFQVLSDVYLSCEKGEIVGLIGRNGCGKSTLMKIIFGSLLADGRFVKVGNKVLNGQSDGKNIIKYLPQDGFLPNHITFETIINLFCDRENAERVKSHHLLSTLLKNKPNQLSGGELRIVEILLVVYSNCEFALLDEPFNGVAPVYKEEIKEIIREQSKTKGFIVSDHDYRNVLDLSTRVVLIHNGATIRIKNKEELIDWGYLPDGAF